MPSTAVVVDRAGDIIVAMRTNNAESPHHGERAHGKPYAAHELPPPATLGVRRNATLTTTPVIRQQLTLPSIIAIPGGLPVKVGQRCDR